MALFDLARCYTTDGWLADANADGLPDQVMARIVLPPDVTPAEALAAAEVAARLGHETMALDGQIVHLAGETDAARGATIRLDSAPTSSGRDEGRIQVDEEGHVTVVGATAAARALALRFLARWVPEVPGGGSLAAVTAWLEEQGRRGGCPVQATISALVFDREGSTLQEIEAVVVTEAERIETIAALLRGHQRPAWPGLTALRLRVRAHDGESVAQIWLGDDLPTPIPEPAVDTVLAAPALGLDLARLFVEDGLLVDRDGDHFADDIRATIEPLPECRPAELVAAANLAARLGLESLGLRLPLAGPHRIEIAPVAGGNAPNVRVEPGPEGGPERIVARGAPAVAWLAAGAPGPIDADHPVLRTRERVLAVLQGTDRLPPPERVVWRTEWSLPWEVDEARRMVEEAVLPQVRPGATVRLDLTLSEPRSVRDRLRDELAAAIRARGGEAEVVVRCAHKPGLSWLVEEIGPRLAALPNLDRVTIACRAFRREPGQEWLSPLLIREYALVDPEGAAELEERIKAMPPGERWLDPPPRWLLELYPGDELLPLPREQVSLDLVEEQDEVYRLLAFDAAGEVLLEAVFTPPWQERPYLDVYPELGSVHPTTGRVRAELDGEAILDERVPTDLERIWDRYQAEILPRLADSVRALAGGEPLTARQPLFSALEIDATLSEPDERLGVREERLSGLEVLHEELYFVTLEFLKELGRREADGPIEAPGGVVPWIHDGVGGPPRLTWTFKAFDGPLPAAEPLLPPGSAEQAVRVVGVTLDGDGKPARLEIEVALDGEGRLAAAKERLSALPGLPIATAIVLRTPEGGRAEIAVGASAEPPPLAGVTPLPLARDRVIGHAEHLGVLAGLRERPGVNVWQAGRSFSGRSLWCVEATLPNGGARTSLAKQAAWKPTLMIVARHHGNEPSSTTASLALVERLAGTPEGQAVLARMNLVVLPYENPDGAELAYRMQEEHPGWMLHAGRFNAFGLEFHRAYGKPGSPALEARVRPLVWRRWRPDAFVDDHGFPSHEWGQPFSGYIPLYPSYWLARGLAYAYLRSIDDPDFPDHKSVAERLRDLMVEEVANDQEVAAWNRTWTERYATYGNSRAPELFPVALYRELVCYLSHAKVDRSADIGDPRNDFCTICPEVTAFALVTEIADETAQGAYMDLCVRAHEAIDWAAVRLLVEADQRFARAIEAAGGSVRRWAGRRRPVRPVPGDS